MLKAQTHLKTNAALCGEIVELGVGSAVVSLTTTEAMVVDTEGLVHGGFIFGQADYAAMLAVNHPHVVLGSCSTKFLKPVQCGESVLAYSQIRETKGKKSIVDVQIKRGQLLVFEGEFICFTLDNHVLA